MGASTADCTWQRAESIPELLNPERNTLMKYRLLGKSGLRVSEASLGTMTFGDEWGWGSPKAEAQKVYETYRRQAETSLTRRISTPMARARNSWVSSCRDIARASFWPRNTPLPCPATIRMRRAITAKA